MTIHASNNYFRYIHILSPFKPETSMGTARRWNAYVWILSVILATPSVVVLAVPGDHAVIVAKIIAGIVVLAVNYVVPGLVIDVTMVLMYRELNPYEPPKTANNYTLKLKRNFIAGIKWHAALFTIFYLPMQLFTVIYYFTSYLVNWSVQILNIIVNEIVGYSIFFRNLYCWCFAVTMLPSFYPPIIYGIYSVSTHII